MARPMGVVRSSASVNDTNPTPEMAEFLERRHQVGHRSSPAIQAPHQYHVDFAAAGRVQHFLAQRTLGCAGTNLFHLHHNAPASPRGILPHDPALQGKSLLVVGGDTSVEARAARGFPSARWVAKNLARIGLGKGPFSGHFRATFYLAGIDSFRPEGIHLTLPGI
jgi:hypothetical protein